MRIAVCDDDPSVCEQLKVIIESSGKTSYEVDSYTSGKEFLCNRNGYDILFLDIDMPGMNGIQTAREIRKEDKRMKIIFVTNYGGYTAYAFGVHAFGYLKKPINPREVICQLCEAETYRMEEQIQEKVELETEQGILRLGVKEICYLEYFNRKLRIVTEQGEFSAKGKITDQLEKLKKYGFAMPHKSFVVNLYHVKNIHGYDITLLDGTVIPLSQKKSKDFRTMLGEFLAGMIG